MSRPSALRSRTPDTHKTTDSAAFRHAAQRGYRSATDLSKHRATDSAGPGHIGSGSKDTSSAWAPFSLVSTSLVSNPKPSRPMASKIDTRASEKGSESATRNSSPTRSVGLTPSSRHGFLRPAVHDEIRIDKDLGAPPLLTPYTPVSTPPKTSSGHSSPKSPVARGREAHRAEDRHFHVSTAEPALKAAYEASIRSNDDSDLVHGTGDVILFQEPESARHTRLAIPQSPGQDDTASPVHEGHVSALKLRPVVGMNTSDEPHLGHEAISKVAPAAPDVEPDRLTVGPRRDSEHSVEPPIGQEKIEVGDHNADEVEVIPVPEVEHHPHHDSHHRFFPKDPHHGHASEAKAQPSEDSFADASHQAHNILDKVKAYVHLGRHDHSSVSLAEDNLAPPIPAESENISTASVEKQTPAARRSEIDDRFDFIGAVHGSSGQSPSEYWRTHHYSNSQVAFLPTGPSLESLGTLARRADEYVRTSSREDDGSHVPQDEHSAANLVKGSPEKDSPEPLHETENQSEGRSPTRTPESRRPGRWLRDLLKQPDAYASKLTGMPETSRFEYRVLPNGSVSRIRSAGSPRAAGQRATDSNDPIRRSSTAHTAVSALDQRFTQAVNDLESLLGQAVLMAREAAHKRGRSMEAQSENTQHEHADSSHVGHHLSARLVHGKADELSDEIPAVELEQGSDDNRNQLTGSAGDREPSSHDPHLGHDSQAESAEFIPHKSSALLSPSRLRQDLERMAIHSDRSSCRTVDSSILGEAHAVKYVAPAHLDRRQDTQQHDHEPGSPGKRHRFQEPHRSVRDLVQKIQDSAIARPRSNSRRHLEPSSPALDGRRRQHRDADMASLDGSLSPSEEQVDYAPHGVGARQKHSAGSITDGRHVPHPRPVAAPLPPPPPPPPVEHDDYFGSAVQAASLGKRKQGRHDHDRAHGIVSLHGRSHVSLSDEDDENDDDGERLFNLPRSRRRKAMARDWSAGRKRYAAAVACLSTALVGVLIGVYAGLVPSIQYYIADQGHAAILGNVVFYLGLALPTFFLWPLPLLHGRKPYVLTSLAVALPLLFPQAMAVSEPRSPETSTWRWCLLGSRAFMGLTLGFASLNFHGVLTDVFGASLMSGNPHQELVDQHDVRRHGGGMGVWLGIWTWCFIGAIAVGFVVGAGIINTQIPAWGLYVSIIAVAVVLVLNVLCPETRPSPYRRSVAVMAVRTGAGDNKDDDDDDDDAARVSRRVARGEAMMHRVKRGPRWWGQEVYHGVLLSLEMLRQPGFAVMTVYSAWIYAQVVLVIVLLGSLTSKYYQFESPKVGAVVSSVAAGALLAVPFQKANLFSRSRHHQQEAQYAAFAGARVTWTSHFARRAGFATLLPVAAALYAVVSTGPPTSVAAPVVFAGAVGFLSCLAISECNGLMMETFDTSDLEPGMTGRARGSLERDRGGAAALRQATTTTTTDDDAKRTNYSSFPRVTAGLACVHALGFVFAAGATGIGGMAERNLGQRQATGVAAGILALLTALLLAALVRFRDVPIIPSSRTLEMDRWTEMMRRETALRERSRTAPAAGGGSKQPFKLEIKGRHERHQTAQQPRQPQRHHTESSRTIKIVGWQQQQLPPSPYLHPDDDRPQQPWRPTLMGNPSGKTRRVNLLELGALSRYTEIRKRNHLIDEDAHRLNRDALRMARDAAAHDTALGLKASDVMHRVGGGLRSAGEKKAAPRTRPPPPPPREGGSGAGSRTGGKPPEEDGYELASMSRSAQGHDGANSSRAASSSAMPSGVPDDGRSEAAGSREGGLVDVDLGGGNDDVFVLGDDEDEFYAKV